MMHQHRGTFFGDVQKMMAQSLYDDSQTDTAIGLAIGVPVGTIRNWRSELGLAEHMPAPRSADDVPWNASGDIPGRENYGRAAPTSPIRPIQSAVPAHVAPPRADRLGATAPQAEPDENALEIGTGIGGRKVHINLEELLTTRLLVQGNSGSGKSHLLRKILEEATGIIQQIVIDPEGDFTSFAEFGHTIIDAGTVGLARMASIAGKVRAHRASAVLNLEAFDPDQKMEATAAFLNGLFDAPHQHWHPALVAVDEAQMFAPIADNGEDPTARKASLGAMTNLMCRGRKRGLAGILATQRVAKLHKNVASEASNFLVGRTFMDIDIARAADLIGLPTRDAKMVRDLNRGEFIGLGPAIARIPSKVKVGDCITSGKASVQGLAPLPTITAEQMQSLVLDEDEEPAPAPALRVVR